MGEKNEGNYLIISIAVGCLRWYLPKEADIAKITQEELDELAAKMNRCPRKCLGYKTPQEMYIQQYKNDCRTWD